MKKELTNIAVLVSGGGTNLQALIDAQGSVITSGRITLVISNSRSAYAPSGAVCTSVSIPKLRGCPLRQRRRPPRQRRLPAATKAAARRDKGGRGVPALGPFLTSGALPYAWRDC